MHTLHREAFTVFLEIKWSSGKQQPPPSRSQWINSLSSQDASPSTKSLPHSGDKHWTTHESAAKLTQFTSWPLKASKQKNIVRHTVNWFTNSLIMQVQDDCAKQTRKKCTDCPKLCCHYFWVKIKKTPNLPTSNSTVNISPKCKAAGQNCAIQTT